MLTTRRSVLAGSAAMVALAAGCGRTGTGAATASNPQLAAAMDQIATNFLKLSPEFCTALAVTEQQAGGRYMDKLSDASKAGLEAVKQTLQQSVTTLNGFDRNSLNHADKVSVDVLTTDYNNQLACLQWEVGGGASLPYVVSTLTGAYQSGPDFLDSQHPITSRETADAYIARLTAFARVLDQETQRIHDDGAAGIIPPDFILERAPGPGETGKKGAIPQIQSFIARAPAQNVLVDSLTRRLPDVHEISAADRATMIRQATSIVHDSIYPAMQRQVDALKQLQPHATHDAGIWHLPHGEEMYAAALKEQTTTNMTPDEVHQLGLDIVNQLQSEMDAILKSQGMSNGTVGERVQAVFQRPDQLYPNTDAGREQCLAYLNSLVQAMRARCPEKFNTLAHADLQIKRVPVYTQDSAPGGYYNGAALDGSRPGAYYINMRDMAELPKFTLPTLTYHEGIPGHHWQISIQQEWQGLPFIRRALEGFNAYAEGWALYAEQLADEMGFYQNDAWGRLGYLKDACFRASRLVVDTGMHAKRMTREDAIHSMNSLLGEKVATTTTEIERYCVWPGQACGYMVGKQTILRLRAHAQQAMGSRFDIKAFHDCLLTNGSTPLTVTETIVNDWAGGAHA